VDEVVEARETVDDRLPRSESPERANESSSWNEGSVTCCHDLERLVPCTKYRRQGNLLVNRRTRRWVWERLIRHCLVVKRDLLRGYARGRWRAWSHLLNAHGQGRRERRKVWKDALGAL
jgi:hypothetical protein